MPEFMKSIITPKNSKVEEKTTINRNSNNTTQKSYLEQTKKNKVGEKKTNEHIFIPNTTQKSYVEQNKKNKVGEKTNEHIFIPNNTTQRSYVKTNKNNQNRTIRNIPNTTNTTKFKGNIKYIFDEYKLAKNRNSKIKVLGKIHDYYRNSINNNEIIKKIKSFLEIEYEKHKNTNYGNLLLMYIGSIYELNTPRVYVPKK